MPEEKNIQVIPLFQRIKKLKIYQDFDLESNDFRFSFPLPSLVKREDGEEIIEDVWTLTKAGFKRAGELSREVSHFPEQIILPDVLEIFLDLPEQIKKIQALKIEMAEIEEELEEIRDNNGDSGELIDTFWNILLFFRLLKRIHENFLKLSPLSPLFNNDFSQYFFEKINDYIVINDSISQKISITSLYHHLKNFFWDFVIFISKIIDFYIDYKEEEKASLFYSLYLVGTYMYRVFDYYPYIIFWGEKRSGKTKNLEIARAIAWNPLPSSHISPSSLFRMIELFQPTLLIDEADPIASEKYANDLKQMLLSGFQKSFPVWRSEEKSKKKTKTFLPKPFDIFSPKILAGIKGFDDVIEDRALTFVMVRSTGEKAERKVDYKDVIFSGFIRPVCLAFAICNFKLVRKLYDKIKIEGNLTPREKDIYKPLLTLAKLCDDIVYEDLLKYLEEKSIERRKSEEEERLDVNILKLLAYKSYKNDYNDYEIKPKDIAEELQNIFEIETTSQKVGMILKKLKFKEKRMVSGKWYYKIRKDYLESLLKEYSLDFENVIRQIEGGVIAV